MFRRSRRAETDDLTSARFHGNRKGAEGQQKLRDRVKVISREAKREMLAEKVARGRGKMGNTYRDRIGGESFQAIRARPNPTLEDLREIRR